jgi:alpha-L-fucosidase
VHDDGSTRPVAFDQHADVLELARPLRHRADDLPSLYRVVLEPLPEAPIELFPTSEPADIELAPLLAGARPGQIVQLGDGRYVGPARVPDGVTLRGLGAHRTTIDGDEGPALALGAHARIEHCCLQGGGQRIVWLPRIVVHLAEPAATMLGCIVDGHIEVTAPDCRVTSSTVTGVVAVMTDRVSVLRSTFRGMNWDTAISIEGGSDHLVEGNDIADVLKAVRLARTLGATVRGNRLRGRWWGVRAIDTEGTNVLGNAIEHSMRAVDIDGGTLAAVGGNAVSDGDSGCLVQRGATDTTVSGNRWERCRIGLLAWDAGAVRHHDNAAVDLAEPDAVVTFGP